MSSRYLGITAETATTSVEAMLGSFRARGGKGVASVNGEYRYTDDEAVSM